MIRLEKYDSEGPEVVHIKFGYGTVGFVEMWWKDDARVGVFFTETQRTEPGIKIPLPEDYRPQIVISFNDIRGIDLLIDTLNDCKQRLKEKQK